MNLLRDLVNSIGTPEITWAMIFAALGYLGKTIVDHYAQKRKLISELTVKRKIETQKEQDVVKISILNQIILIDSSVFQICHQFLGHAETEARVILGNGKKIKRTSSVPVYLIEHAVLGLGSLLAQLNNFQTYQYMSIQRQLRNVDLLKKIDALEEILSRSGVFRGHQKDLAIFVLQEEKKDFTEIIKSKKRRGRSPQFLVSSIVWAENLVYDFIDAWAKLRMNTTELNTANSKKPENESPTLSRLEIDLSETVGKAYLSTLGIQDDVRRLQVGNESIEFLQALNELNIELKAVYRKLDKEVNKHKRA